MRREAFASGNRRPRTGGLAIVAASALLLTCVVVSAVPAAPPAGSVSSHVTTQAARSAGPSSTVVGFSLAVLPISVVTVVLRFSATMNLSGGGIVPGQSVNATASVFVPPRVMLGLNYSGVGTSFAIQPLGKLVDVPIPGLVYTVLGFNLGLYLNFSGQIIANGSLTGPASGAPGPYVWNASGSTASSIRANSTASSGAVIGWAVSGIRYTIALGIDAIGSVPFGGRISVPILHFGRLGDFPGSPSTVSAGYVVSSPSSGLAFTAAPLTLVGGGVATGLAVVGLSLLFVRKRRRKQPPPGALYLAPVPPSRNGTR